MVNSTCSLCSPQSPAAKEVPADSLPPDRQREDRGCIVAALGRNADPCARALASSQPDLDQIDNAAAAWTSAPAAKMTVMVCEGRLRIEN